MGPERAGKGAAIVTERAVNVPKNSCAPKGTVPATSAEQFLTAVEARKDWDVSDRTAATIGAYPATRIDIVLPADTSICGAGKDYMVVAHNDGTGFYSQGPSMHVTYWVADVNGEPLLVERFSFAETPASTWPSPTRWWTPSRSRPDRRPDTDGAEPSPRGFRAAPARSRSPRRAP
jgi:hypothetical protein